MGYPEKVFIYAKLRGAEEPLTRISYSLGLNLRATN